MSKERRLIFLLGVIQFVNILDFMMVMPLGPDFSEALGIPTSKLGLVAGSYTLAAAISGLIASNYLDRFDRRSALTFAMAGLAIGTLAGAFAPTATLMVCSRLIAGAFGGPASSLAMSIVSDVVPPERRGRAMGALFGAFSLASTFGVPAGLELAKLGGWRAPFLAVGVLSVIITIAAFFILPSMRGHIAGSAKARRSFAAFASEPLTAMGLLSMGVTMAGMFALLPNLSAYVQFNGNYPREKLGILYLVGGIVNFAVMRVAGQLVDRFGPVGPTTFGTVVYALVCVFGFMWGVPLIPVMAIFVGIMFANPFRMVAFNALSSKIPAPQERARFMSTQSAVHHIAAAIGAGVGSLVLSEGPKGELVGMPAVTGVSILLSLILPGLVWKMAKMLALRPAPVPEHATAAPHERVA